MLGRVRDQVLKATGDRQVPWDSSSLRGEFYFRPPEPDLAASLDEPVTQAPPIATQGYAGRDREAFEVIAESKRARDFAIFLERYPDSTLAPFAQSRLDELGVEGKSAEPPAKDAGGRSAAKEPAVAAVTADAPAGAPTPPSRSSSCPTRRRR